MGDESNMGTDEFWREPRTVDQVGCSACGETHEMDYYPVAHPPDVGEKEIGAFINPDTRIIASGVCPETEEVVLVYSEGWETKEGFTRERVCECATGAPSDTDDRFCSECGAVLPGEERAAGMEIDDD